MNVNRNLLFEVYVEVKYSCNVLNLSFTVYGTTGKATDTQKQCHFPFKVKVGGKDQTFYECTKTNPADATKPVSRVSYVL